MINVLPVLSPSKSEFAAIAVKRALFPPPIAPAVTLIYQLDLLADHWIGWAKSPGALSLTLELTVSIPPLLLLIVIKLPDPPNNASFLLLASLIWLLFNVSFVEAFVIA